MIDLEERLRRAAELLDDVSWPTIATEDLSPWGAPGERRSDASARVVACLVIVLGLVGVAWVATRGGPAAPAVGSPVTTVAGTSPRESLPAIPEVAPVATFPPATGVPGAVPPTVVGTAPTDWYRLQPDLDVAWYSDAAGTASMLCFRTPAGSECQPDQFAPTASSGGPIAVRSIGDQYLIVTLDPEAELTVMFDDGQSVGVPLRRDPAIGWSVARVQTPPGASAPVGMAMTYSMAQPAVTTAPATAPATLATPPATVAGPPVTNPPSFSYPYSTSVPLYDTSVPDVSVP